MSDIVAKPETKNPFALWLNHEVIFRTKAGTYKPRHRAKVLQIDGLWVTLEFLGGRRENRYSPHYEIIEVHV